MVIKQQSSKTQSIEKEGIETSLDGCKNPWDGHRHLGARTRGENGRERGEGGGGSCELVSLLLIMNIQHKGGRPSVKAFH